MLPSNNEKYKIELYKRIPNSPYEWESKPTITFRGRPASQYERKNYRVQQGVHGGTDSQFVVCSNLPENIKEQDKVVFMGKEWSVESVGYYYDESRFVNAGIMSEEYIAKRCPKGMTLQ